MKLHEMKVERDVNSITERHIARQFSEESQQKKDSIDEGGNSTMRTTFYSNFDLDKIEEKVNKIMQKYCTPVHPHASRFEPGRHSTIERTLSSL